MAKLTKEGRDALPEEDFAVPGKRALPMHDEDHVKMAWDMVSRTKDLTPAERAEARRRIKERAKKFGLDTSGWETKVSAMSITARSLNVPAGPHPNKMPFSGVLTRIDEPSDAAPDGSGGKRVMITAEAAEQALDSLLGMAVDYQPNFDGHDPRAKIGIIDNATIEGNAICINGFIYAADFPEVAAEIKANKDRLGFSFEARDLWTNDPKADPVPILDCVFTGAAILLKDKAAYRTTSISARAEGDSIMTEFTKEQMAALLADAVKPLNDKIDAQGAKLAELEKAPDRIMAANHLAKVEKHANELEKAADHMDAAGIGGHPVRGHAAIARNMANDLRAKAAGGTIPAVYDSFYASADTMRAGAEDHVKKVRDEVTADLSKKIDEVKAAADKAEVKHKDEVAGLNTKIADLQAQVQKAKEAQDNNVPQRKTLSPLHSGLLAKAGIELPSDNSTLDVKKVDKMLAEANLSIDQRFQVKSALSQVGAL